MPRVEVDQWTDLDAATAAHLMTVAHRIGQAQKHSSTPPGRLMIAGFEVPHVHVHVVPINGMGDLDFTNAETDPDQAALDEIRQQLAAALGT